MAGWSAAARTRLAWGAAPSCSYIVSALVPESRSVRRRRHRSQLLLGQRRLEDDPEALEPGQRAPKQLFAAHRVRRRDARQRLCAPRVSYELGDFESRSYPYRRVVAVT